MELDRDLLYRLEEDLKPHRIEECIVPITVLDYGDISIVFKIEGRENLVFKRMPLFRSMDEAERFAAMYREYNSLLEEAGLRIPPAETTTIQVSGRPVIVLFLAQQLMPPEAFGHRLVHGFSDNENRDLFEKIMKEISKVWEFNRKSMPGIELALDAQLSNWVLHEDRVYYVDTSTPLYRKDGVEQINQNVEAFLKSVPTGLRWIFRKVFINDIIPRYYDPHKVFVDFASNLNNERPEVIPTAIDVINGILEDGNDPITEEEVAKYYEEDRKIWLLFLSLRRADRWVKTKLFRRRYEFTLPLKSSFQE